MESAKLLSDIKAAVTKAHSILLVTHGTHSHDSIGATLALYLGLMSLEKTVSVSSPDPIHVEVSDYIGADKILPTIGKKNFVISLPYKDGSIEKVSYNIEDNFFNLVIEPRAGFEFSKDTVVYSNKGGTPDCIIVVDTVHLGKLGALYEENKDMFGGASTIINIDTHEENKMYGSINLVESNTSSTTELVAVVLSSLGVQLSNDIATNILNAIYETTDNFTSPHVNGRTFEVASVCMKAGGARFSKTKGQDVIIGKQEDQPTSPDPATPPQTPPVEPEEWLKPNMYKSS